MRQRQEETTQVKKTTDSSDLFTTIPTDEFPDPVWENGQHVMQNQCDLPWKSSLSGSFSTQSSRGVNAKHAKGRISPNSVKLAGVTTPEDFVRIDPSSDDVGNNDGVVPCIKDQLKDVFTTEAFENDACAGYLNDFMGFDPLSSSVHKNTIIKFPSACLGEALGGNSSNVKHEHGSRSPIGSSELVNLGRSKLFESTVLNLKSKVFDVSTDGSNACAREHSKDMVEKRLLDQRSPSSNVLQKQSGSLLNFSHFARPVLLAKVLLRNAAGMRSLQELPNLANSNRVTSTPIERKLASSPYKMDLEPNTTCPEEVESVQQSNDIDLDNKNPSNRSKLPDDVPNSAFVSSMALNKNEIRMGHEAVVVPSMCSGNFAEAASDESKLGEKRKELEGEESDYHSEDLQDTSVSMRRRAKRTRASEVRNLSAKKRRNSINKKIDALQELIPNCDKMDKASVLEEAIDYLKTLQLQVQMMSMARGLYMPTTTMHSVTTAHLPPVGVGISKDSGFGFGMGVYDTNLRHWNASMAQIPHIVPPLVSSPVTSGQSGLSKYPGSSPVTSGQSGLSKYPGSASSQMIGAPMPRMPPFGTLAWTSGTTSASAHTDTAT